jgi:hypothetical protein
MTRAFLEPSVLRGFPDRGCSISVFADESSDVPWECACGCETYCLIRIVVFSSLAAAV